MPSPDSAPLRKPRQPARCFLALGAGDGHGYRSTPLRRFPEVADPPEVVDKIAAAVTLQDEPEGIGKAVAEYIRDAHLYDAQRHVLATAVKAKARTERTTRQRLQDVEHRCKVQRVDFRSELYAIGKALERAANAGRKEPASALARLEAVEQRLDLSRAA